MRSKSSPETTSLPHDLEDLARAAEEAMDLEMMEENASDLMDFDADAEAAVAMGLIE